MGRLPSVLQIHTSAWRGGAARMALALHAHLNEGAEIRSTYLSGEGSANLQLAVDSLGVGSMRRISNVLAFRLLGVDGVFNRSLWASKQDAMAAADLVHLHNAHGYYLPHHVLAHILGRPAVWTLHDFWLGTGRRPFPAPDCGKAITDRVWSKFGSGYPVEWLDRARTRRRVLHDLVTSSKVRLVAPTESARQRLAAMGVPSQRVAVVNYGLFSETRAPSPKLKGAAKSQLHLDQKRRIGLFAAARVNAPRKGFSAFVKALGLMRRPERWTFIVAGAGACLADQAIRRARRSCAQFPEIRSIGFVRPGDMAVWYRAADVYVTPTQDETFGLAALEAAAEGATVVCSDLEVLREVLGDLAIRFPPSDPEALAEILDRLGIDHEQSDPELLTRLRDRFSISRMAESYTRLYADVIR